MIRISARLFINSKSGMFKYLKHIELPYTTEGSTWTISPISGSLLRSKAKICSQISIPQKVKNAIEFCDNPYLCRYHREESQISNISKVTFDQLDRMHSVFLKLNNKHFYLSRLYASIRKNLFLDTYNSLSAISLLPTQKLSGHLLCLQRSLLTAKISKDFESKGVIFIGAFLPSVEMHAWIIEDGFQPDRNDREWIHYRPLLALYYE